MYSKFPSYYSYNCSDTLNTQLHFLFLNFLIG
nr:MAG TPA: hypothetical protein [Caudoviricetes sp.]